MRRSCRITFRSVLLGAGLLWFGWFGFNAGSALAAGPIAGLAFVTTMLAPAATLVVWTFLDMMRSRQANRRWLCNGDRRRAGRHYSSRRLHQPDERDRAGAIAAVPSYLASSFAPRRRSTIRLTSSRRTEWAGRSGALLTGVFADKALNGVFDGALHGNPAQVGIQAAAVPTAIVYSGGMSFILLKLISLFIPLRATHSDEATGLDVTMHGEEAYLNITE